MKLGECTCVDHSREAGTSCGVIAFFRTPPEERRALYFEQLKKRTEANGNGPPRDERYRLGRLGVPGNALAALGRLRATKALDAAKEWWASNHHFVPALLFSGPTGSGKTTAAAWCCQEFAREWSWNGQPSGGTQREPLVWLDASKLTGIREWTDAGSELVEKADNARLLVVDDAGHEGTRVGLETLINLLMSRLDKAKSTILSTNVRGEAYRLRYSVPLADRLRTQALICDLAGEKSMRGAT